MKARNFLNIFLIAMCLSVILGCKAISDMGSGKSDTTPTPGSSPASTPVSTPTPSTNKLVGNWSGKSADGSNNLKMNFTEDEWTLYSNGSAVGGTSNKYKFTDSETIEVTTRDGSKFPMKVVVSGDTLNVDMRGTKVVMRRDS